jgi:hypothetical protein
MLVNPARRRPRVSAAGLLDELINGPFSSQVAKLIETIQQDLFIKVLNGEFSIYDISRRQISIDKAKKGDLILIDVCAILKRFLDKRSLDRWVNIGLEVVRSRYRDFQNAVSLEGGKSNMLELVTRKQE